MSKKLISLLLAATLAWTAWAQEENAPEDPTADTEVAAEEDASGSAESEDLPDEPEEPEDADDGVLDAAFEDASPDEQTYEEDEDDFVPSEEIPADEPIPFPSNI